MQEVNKYIMYPKTDDIKDKDNAKLSLTYDGTLESLKDAIGKIKISVELKAICQLENMITILEFLQDNFKEYLLSEVNSIVLTSRLGYHIIIIKNEKIGVHTRSIQVESGQIIVEEIKKLQRINSFSETYSTAIIIGIFFGYLLFRR